MDEQFLSYHVKKEYINGGSSCGPCMKPQDPKSPTRVDSLIKKAIQEVVREITVGHSSTNQDAAIWWKQCDSPPIKFGREFREFTIPI